MAKHIDIQRASSEARVIDKQIIAIFGETYDKSKSNDLHSIDE